MQIQLLKTDALIPYAQNSRKHSDAQIDRIAQSITEFGFNQPLVVDDKNIVLVGHGRLLAAKKLNLDKVPVHQITGLSEAQKRAYRILDNKIGTESEWDFQALQHEMELLALDEYPVSEWDLDCWQSEEIEGPEGQVDAAPEKLIVITCDDEKQQQELFVEFDERGLACKLIG